MIAYTVATSGGCVVARRHDGENVHAGLGSTTRGPKTRKETALPVCLADSVLAWHGVKSSRNRLRSPFSLVVPSLIDYAVHVAARPLAIIGDENARLRSRLPLTEWSSAMEQASFNQMYRFDQSPSAQAERLRKEARGTPAGVRRDQLLRRARQIETASSVQERPKSPGLKSPT